MGGQCSKWGAGASYKKIEKKEHISIGILQKGLVVLTRATEEDENRNYDEALRLYVQGVIYFLHVAKYHAATEHAEDCIREKCEMYIARIQKIKACLNQAHGYGTIDHLKTLSNKNVLDLVTEIICLNGDLKALKLPEK